ncbi:superoxide dismutase family protein [Bacillus altitudinis]|uniref:superoxide dismutase family protein n=1 Tax=Bacillus altitudinis TaxID=293387 RepID=UPI0009C01B31|nr:superoxide dismutase family protein [Bacillus altitudinis]OQP22606.1 superoxide dismutase [Bacillus stratosphericus]MBS4747379.1 superoxide dismutase family protein [Bacillus altitudinis]MBU8968829.1 superoxide dismutase family protein [Bacillus altitudinis]MDT1118457.1 superoxide dismutase family protein [Bacillus altitudinis]BDC55187.1 superoxide dismutase-like protein YojM [Bacillus altitudinis]
MKKSVWMIMICLIFTASACHAPPKKETTEETREVASPKQAPVTTSLINESGQKIGSIEIRESSENGLDLHVKAKGLPPGPHGFHIHETGICETPDFETAGAHFNPTHREHGFDNPKGHHAGDMPNLEVGADGQIDVVVNVPDVTLKGGPNQLIDQNGRSFIIHAEADDYLSNPSGNSGKRIACGAITKEMVK